jgi:RNA polymerase sigma-70 factor, ECF subfamily
VSEPHTSTVSGSGPTDAALVVAARAGEAWAQEALFARHAPRLLGLAQRMLGSSDDADDLVQDAFVRALSHLQRLKNPQAFAAWLMSIAVHGAQKRLRRRRMLVRLGLRSAAPHDPDLVISSSAPPDVALELQSVYAAVRDLPAEERIALVLRRVEGLELTEIAETMGLSLATVKRRLTAAEGHFKTLLNSNETQIS